MEGFHFNRLSALRGQSLIELLIAIGVASLFIAGVTGTIGVALRSSIVGREAQSASYLAQELLDAATVVANSDWLSIASLAADAYIILPSTITLGREIRMVNDNPYTRYFFIESVSRTLSGDIIEPYDAVSDDPSTKRLVVTVSWSGGGPFTLTKIITRHTNAAFVQTDWFGGPLQQGLIVDSTRFAIQDGIDVSQSGSLKLSGF